MISRWKLRQKARSAVRSGQHAFGIVESFHNGLVTVRIGNSKGARLTNLRLIGETVYPGQRVRIDYSSGNPPVVLSEMQMEEVVQEIPESSGSGIPETQEDNDISCHCNQDWWPLETQFNEGPGEWHLFKFGGNGWAIPTYTGWDVYPYPDPIHWEYDNAQFVDKSEYYTTHLTIPKAGKYLLTGQMNMYGIIHWAITFEYRFKCNGDIIVEKSFCTRQNDGPTNVNMYDVQTLESFMSGDIITLEYRWFCDPNNISEANRIWYNSGNWAFRQFVTLNYWPGT